MEKLEAKIKKLDAYINRLGGNSSSIKMRKVALKRKLWAMEAEYNELKENIG